MSNTIFKSQHGICTRSCQRQLESFLVSSPSVSHLRPLSPVCRVLPSAASQPRDPKHTGAGAPGHAPSRCSTKRVCGSGRAPFPCPSFSVCHRRRSTARTLTVDGEISAGGCRAEAVRGSVDSGLTHFSHALVHIVKLTTSWFCFLLISRRMCGHGNVDFRCKLR